MKNTGDVWGDLEGYMYPFFNWSSRNAVTSSCSAGDRGMICPFFALNMSLRSIAWSHGFHSSMCSDSFFKNILRNLWYSFGTSSKEGFVMGNMSFFTVPLLQLMISGLWCLSQENPRINEFFSRSVTSAMIFSWCPWNLTISSTVFVILPAEFHVPSTLYTGIGFHKGVSSTLCFCTHVQCLHLSLEACQAWWSWCDLNR